MSEKKSKFDTELIRELAAIIKDSDLGRSKSRMMIFVFGCLDTNLRQYQLPRQSQQPLLQWLPRQLHRLPRFQPLLRLQLPPSLRMR